MTAHSPEQQAGAAMARIPENARVYAIGDVHGRFDLLNALHARILKDAEGRSAGRRVLVYLGDYIDRGPDSRQVVESLIREPLPGFETVYLKGNHEDYLLKFLERPNKGPNWFWNGGLQTLRSYGIELRGDPADLAFLEDVRISLQRALPESHLRFYRSLALHHREGDYLFVHAGIRPGLPLARQDEHDLMWIRDTFLNSRTDHGAVVVHGHSISWEPDVQDNRIGIDTGAFTSDVLTCLVLDGAERSFLAT
ncbi:MAG: metallophosphoesterase family protein [Alphaproteobacteria bacterium]|nr:metallophosphoesterase family protein [Alphaproteobacteria bacterium]